MTANLEQDPFWFQIPKDEEEATDSPVARAIFKNVRAIEEQQCDMRERIFRCAQLYDPYYTLEGLQFDYYNPGSEVGPVTENVIADIVDTATSLIAAAAVDPKFETNGADFEMQAMMEKVERVVQADFHRAGVQWQCVQAFKDACISGLGTISCYDKNGFPWFERVHWDEMIYDEIACMYAPPVEVKRRKIVNRKMAKIHWPKFDKDIDNAPVTRTWTTYRQLNTDEIVIIEAYVKPIFDEDGDIAQEGRHIICIENKCFVDEPWKEDFFPFIHYKWNEKQLGMWGKSLIEDLAGGQLKINRMNSHIEKVNAFINKPRVLIPKQDANLKLVLDERIGAKVLWGVSKPEFWVPPPINAELYQEKENTKKEMRDCAGINEMSMHAQRPEGIEAGVALRQLRDIQSQRFSIQTQRWEKMNLECAEQDVALRQRMGGSVKYEWREGNIAKTIDWKSFNLSKDSYTINVQAASITGMTPSGKLQSVVELSQAGVTTPQQSLQLLDHPDLKKFTEVEEAPLRDAQSTVKKLMNGETVVPHPFQDLQMCIKYVTAAFLNGRNTTGAPANILLNMENYITAALDKIMESQPQPQQAQPPGMPQPDAQAGQPMPQSNAQQVPAAGAMQ